MSQKINFEGHRGVMWLLDHSAMFYGVRFMNITEATRFLRGLEPGGYYQPWCRGNIRGVKNLKNDKVFIENRWMDCEKSAELYVKLFCCQK